MQIHIIDEQTSQYHQVAALILCGKSFLIHLETSPHNEVRLLQ